MVSVELLTVGKELLIGKTVNTNAYWIGGRLAKMGGMLHSILVVTDSLAEISSALKEILERKPDFVLVVGGLGPTPDDMTMEGLALALGRKLRPNPEAIHMIKDHYRKISGAEIELTPARKKMATLPDGSVPLYNSVGTAPGARIEQGSTVIFSLPGVPREMKSIFKEIIEAEVRQKVGRYYSKTIIMNLEKIFESTLAPIIKEATRKYPDAYIKSHPKGLRDGISRIELDVVFTSREKSEAETMATMIAQQLITHIKQSGGVVTSAKGITLA